MILPDKTIRLSNSLLSVGSVLLGTLREPRTVSDAWTRVRANPHVMSFEVFVLALDFLHAVGLVTIEEGLLVRRRP